MSDISEKELTEVILVVKKLADLYHSRSHPLALSRTACGTQAGGF